MSGLRASREEGLATALFANRALATKLPRVVEGCLWLASLTAVLYFTLSMRQDVPMAVSSANKPMQARHAAFDIKKLIASAPFGVAKQRPRPPHEDDRHASPSQRQIKLIGTITGEKAAAILELNGKDQQRVIHKGEKVLPSVTLVEVLPEEIVIEADGRRETVRLAGFGQNGNAGTNALHQEAGAQGAGGAPDVDAISSEQLAEGAKDVRGLSYYVAGEAVGFMLTSVAPDSPLGRIGMRPQDVIKSVNARPVTNAGQFTAALAGASHAKELEVEMLRNGSQRKLRLNVR